MWRDVHLESLLHHLTQRSRERHPEKREASIDYRIDTSHDTVAHPGSSSSSYCSCKRRRRRRRRVLTLHRSVWLVPCALPCVALRCFALRWYITTVPNQETVIDRISVRLAHCSTGYNLSPPFGIAAFAFAFLRERERERENPADAPV